MSTPQENLNPQGELLAVPDFAARIRGRRPDIDAKVFAASVRRKHPDAYASLDDEVLTDRVFQKASDSDLAGFALDAFPEYRNKVRVAPHATSRVVEDADFDAPLPGEKQIEFKPFEASDMSLPARIAAAGAKIGGANLQEVSESSPLRGGKLVKATVRTDGRSYPNANQLSDALLESLGALEVGRRYRAETGRNLLNPAIGLETLKQGYDPQTKSYSFEVQPTSADIRVVNAYAKGGVKAAEAEIARMQEELDAEGARSVRSRDAARDFVRRAGINPDDLSEGNGAVAKGVGDAIIGSARLINNAAGFVRDPKDSARDAAMIDNAQAAIPEEKTAVGRLARGVTGVVASAPRYAVGAPVVAMTENLHRGKGEAVKAGLSIGVPSAVARGAGISLNDRSPVARQIAARNLAGMSNVATDRLSGASRSGIESYLEGALLPVGKKQPDRAPSFSSRGILAREIEAAPTISRPVVVTGRGREVGRGSGRIFVDGKPTPFREDAQGKIHDFPFNENPPPPAPPGTINAYHTVRRDAAGNFVTNTVRQRGEGLYLALDQPWTLGKKHVESKGQREEVLQKHVQIDPEKIFDPHGVVPGTNREKSKADFDEMPYFGRTVGNREINDAAARTRYLQGRGYDGEAGRFSMDDDRAYAGLVTELVIFDRSKVRDGWVRSGDPVRAGVGAEINAAINLPRAGQSSFDNSANLRQNLILGVLHPKRGAEAFGKSFQALASSSKTETLLEQIHSSPAMNRKMEDAGLYLASKNRGEGTKFLNRDEAYASKWAQHIPGIKQSERAFTVATDYLRASVFSDYVKAHPDATPQTLQGVARFINYASGRGSLTGRRGIDTALAQVFYSPRYALSRPQLLTTPFRGTPEAKAFARQELTKFFAGTAGVLGLAKLAGASISLDPTDPDFAKIKIGNQRIDLGAGYAQLFRYLAQATTGRGRSLKTGGEYEAGRGDVALRFVRTKLSPQAGLVVNVAFGKDLRGQKTGLGNEVKKLAVPLSFGDIAEAWEDAGGGGALLGSLSLLGAGVQTIKPPTDEEELQMQFERLKEKPELKGLTDAHLMNNARVRVAINPLLRQIEETDFSDAQKESLRHGLNKYLYAAAARPGEKRRIADIERVATEKLRGAEYFLRKKMEALKK